MLEQYSWVLPKAVRRQLRFFRMRNEWRRLGAMTREAAFNDVYVRGLWGSESEGLSGEGSYGDLAEHYVQIVEDMIHKIDAASVLDLGTGDFNIGQKLCHLVEQFIAADVSSVIIERNRVLFAAERTVNFIQLDACSDPLPRADLVLIRQVLQHLSNDEIEAVLQNLERSGCRRALIVEHHPASTEFKQENTDLPAHGPHLRIADGSGVYLDRPPFSRKTETVATCPYRRGETLTYYIWECGTESV